MKRSYQWRNGGEKVWQWSLKWKKAKYHESNQPTENSSESKKALKMAKRCGEKILMFCNEAAIWRNMAKWNLAKAQYEAYRKKKRKYRREEAKAINILICCLWNMKYENEGWLMRGSCWPHAAALGLLMACGWRGSAASSWLKIPLVAESLNHIEMKRRLPALSKYIWREYQWRRSIFVNSAESVLKRLAESWRRNKRGVMAAERSVRNHVLCGFSSMVCHQATMQL